MFSAKGLSQKVSNFKVTRLAKCDNTVPIIQPGYLKAPYRTQLLLSALTFMGSISIAEIYRRKWKSDTAWRKQSGVNCCIYELKALKSWIWPSIILKLYQVLSFSESNKV
jgi:hypothetical protein